MPGCLPLFVRWLKRDHLTRQTSSDRGFQETPTTIRHGPDLSPHSNRNGERGLDAPAATLNAHCADGVTANDELPPPPPYQTTPLETLPYGDEIETEAILEQSAIPDKKCNLGSALLEAIREGHIDSSVKMLREGADPDAKDFYGFALTQAIRGGYEKVVTELLRRGADSGVKDSTVLRSH
ncbi:uncharacterized protein N7446_010534 [Penicillium canescens]|uniref:Ankyrin repeat protein n=1 Tax=Penicillium canescens TaxID=5083 RepID=A0AAD6N887_PENCN|nr:uncharacterized protein N7446_010534 [Penicillium canescens]KAJ6041582.1 hypothetical protein N7460_006972 [Penicillium canescens]KAJ6050425.1 hypothetical protein N7446_010534 [Penicillium canescens]KAJ6064729.1 hypothetical protein N7444_000382 [Penicillium canescens]